MSDDAMSADQERVSGALPGVLGLFLVFIAVPAAVIWLISQAISASNGFSGLAGILLGIAWFFLLNGFFIV